MTQSAHQPPPKTRTVNWRGEVQKADPDWQKPETVYKFSNGREFKSTDRQESGVYRRP